MPFHLSKVARCKPRKIKKYDDIKIRKRDQTNPGRLLAEANALPSVPSPRRRRRPMPIPTFYPIDTYGEDEKVDLSIFDTPPVKKKNTRENETSLKKGDTESSNLNSQTAVETHDIPTVDSEPNNVGTETETQSSVKNSFRNQSQKAREIHNLDFVPITTDKAQSTSQAQRQFTPERFTKNCSTKTNPASNTISLNVSSPKMFRNPQPDRTALTRSVDNLFQQVDIAKVTLKDIREAIETEYDVKLNKTNKHLIKDRLSNIINGNVQPMSHSNVRQEKDSTGSETKNSKTTNFSSLIRLPKIPAVQSEATTLLSPSRNLMNPDQSTFLARSSILETKIFHSVQEMVTPTKRPTTQVNASSTIKPSTVNKSHGPIHDCTEMAASTLIRSALNKAMVENIRENTTTTSKFNFESDDDLEIPGPALSRPHTNTVLSRSRIRNISRHKIKAPPAMSIGLTLGVPPHRGCRKRARIGSCALCITCPCQNNRTETVDSSPAFALAWNDKEIEKALIRRVKKLEKTCDKYEGDLDQVNRELKRHRKSVIKQQETLVTKMRQQKIGGSHFLPDANIWQHHMEEMKQTRLQREVVQQAKLNLFSFHPNFQPTLTQMLGVRSKKIANEADDKAVAIEDDDIESAGEMENSVSIDDDDSVVNHDGTIENESVTDRVHRLKWNGPSELPSTQSPLLARTGQGLWGALKPLDFSEKCSDKYVCAWDQIFMKEQLVEGGVEELLDLFEQEVGNSQEPECRASLSTLIENSLVDLTMLSQPSQQLAKSIESKVIADAEKHAMVEHICPHWKENVRYALHQHNEVDIESALEKIRQSRIRMDSRKEKMLAAWMRQQVVLDLYETSLTESLNRLEEKKIVPPLTSQGFFVVENENSDCRIDRSSVGLTSNDVTACQPLSPIDECLSEDDYHSKELDTQNDSEVLSCTVPFSQVPCR